MKGDTDFVSENITEDVRWTLVGNSTIHEKSDFIIAMESMKTEESKELTITSIITHGISAAIEDTVKVTSLY